MVDAPHYLFGGSRSKLEELRVDDMAVERKLACLLPGCFDDWSSECGQERVLDEPNDVVDVDLLN